MMTGLERKNETENIVAQIKAVCCASDWDEYNKMLNHYIVGHNHIKLTSIRTMLCMGMSLDIAIIAVRLLPTANDEDYNNKILMAFSLGFNFK